MRQRAPPRGGDTTRGASEHPGAAPRHPRPPRGRLRPRSPPRLASTLLTRVYHTRALLIQRAEHAIAVVERRLSFEEMGAGSSTNAVHPARQRRSLEALQKMDVSELQEVVTVRSRLSRIRLSFIWPSLSPPEESEGVLPKMRKILENDGDLLDFTNFLTREFADEPLQFYAAISDFTTQFGSPTEKQAGMVALPRRFTTVEEVVEDVDEEAQENEAVEARQAAAREIFDEFLATDAPRQVHVPNKMRKALKKELDAGLCLPCVFRPALGEVLTALARDKLVPFVTSQRNDKRSGSACCACWRHR